MDGWILKLPDKFEYIFAHYEELVLVEEGGSWK